MNFVLFFNLIFSSNTQIFSKPRKLIRLPIKLREVAPIAIQFNITLPFHDGVQIIFNFRILKARNISGHYIIWNISERNIISNSKALMDSILFFICKFVKHARHVWYFIMVWYFAFLYKMILTDIRNQLRICFFAIDNNQLWQVQTNISHPKYLLKTWY